jgi:hypothetical protein
MPPVPANGQVEPFFFLPIMVTYTPPGRTTGSACPKSRVPDGDGEPWGLMGAHGRLARGRIFPAPARGNSAPYIGVSLTQVTRGLSRLTAPSTSDQTAWKPEPFRFPS